MEFHGLVCQIFDFTVPLCAQATILAIEIADNLSECSDMVVADLDLDLDRMAKIDEAHAS